ncbi:class I SAM-dependent methyltransferase [Micromonosporaceae bacterium Da 78-11]
MIGGEMPSWTEDRPAVGGALLTHLVDRLPSGARVLIAGPHTDQLIDTLAARADVTCLIRSQPEAIALDARGLDVLCGTLPQLITTGPGYDVVVALDGLDRLCSVEGPQYDWIESLRALKRALRPGGTLLLAVENELGVHRLVDPATPTSAQTDGAWRPLGEFGTKPGNPTRLAARLSTEGLAVDWLGAAWPLPEAPTLIATPNALQDGPVDALAATAAGAVGRAYAGKSVLSDPRRLAAAAVRGGLGPEFAASWLAVAHLAPRPSTPLTVPPVLIGDGPVIEVAPGPGGWVRTVVRDAPDRDLTALTGPLPAGRLLEELLLGACLRHDLPVLRRLLTGWTAALPTAGADNVVVHGDTFELLDPSVGPEAHVLRGFAQTLVGGGYPHPWPAALDVDSLVTVLHGAAGLPASPAGTTVTGPPVPDARREHEEQLRALRRQLADSTSRVQWYEAELDRRDLQLRQAHLQIAAFSGTVGYRVAKIGFKAARGARNRLRKGLS